MSLCLGVIAILAMTSSCRSQKLTRDSATDIMNKVGGLSDLFHAIILGPDEASKMMHMDANTAKKLMTFMDLNHPKSCLPDKSDIRLVTGKYVFCSVYSPHGVDAQHPGVMLTLTKPVGWKIVEITGISSDSNTSNDKVVEYTWKYDLSEYGGDVEEIFNPTPPAH
jgi:hypothetical protein